jgi:hypothetical protein
LVGSVVSNRYISAFRYVGRLLYWHMESYIKLPLSKWAKPFFSVGILLRLWFNFHFSFLLHRLAPIFYSQFKWMNCFHPFILYHCKLTVRLL